MKVLSSLPHPRLMSEAQRRWHQLVENPRVFEQGERALTNIGKRILVLLTVLAAVFVAAPAVASAVANPAAPAQGVVTGDDDDDDDSGRAPSGGVDTGGDDDDDDGRAPSGGVDTGGGAGS